MRTAALPSEDLPPLTRSVAACLAAILEIETAEVPAPAADHPEPWTAWRVWLATRGLGLVPIERPKEFAWPGPWLALLTGDRAAVAYGSPPRGGPRAAAGGGPRPRAPRRGRLRLAAGRARVDAAGRELRRRRSRLRRRAAPLHAGAERARRRRRDR